MIKKTYNVPVIEIKSFESSLVGLANELLEF